MAHLSPFETYAEDYDRWFLEKLGSLIFESEVKAMEKLTFTGYGVEVGVGTGAFSSRLGIPLGLDPAFQMAKIAKKRGIDVIRAVGECLPLQSNCLDFVLFALTICFLRDFQTSLKEAQRVLKPQGSIVIGFISQESKWGKLYSTKKAEGHRFYKDATFYSIREVEEALASVGFKITKCFATLTQDPSSVTGIEEPSTNVAQSGFVCLQAIRS